MAIHHEHGHARVFNGLEKRDSHGADIKMNVPEVDNKMRFIHNHPKLYQEEAVETVYSEVRITHVQTLQPTPSTDAASTQTSLNAQQSYARAKSLANQPHTSAQTSLSPQQSYAQAKSLANQSRTYAQSSASANRAKGSPLQRTRSAESTSFQTTSTGSPKAVGGSPIQTTRGPSAVGGTPLSATRSGSAELIAEKSHGMSSSAKAGVAFGIIIAIGLVAGLVLFCVRRRKNQLKKEGRQQIVDEKHASQNSFGGGSASLGAPLGDYRASTLSDKSLRSTRTASTAPRLSLRPVTQFLPGFGGAVESRKDTGNALDVPAMSEKPKSAWERRPQGAEQNPFADAAPSVNPFDEGDGTKSSASHSAKPSWEGSEPPTPKSTKFGTASAVPITAAAPPMPRNANNVHRVQLDFKPSMEDELELRSGQLVRMLHEYDDGWALCIRMDRSQQGVCPRTCLSKLPVKPRPQGAASQEGSPPGRPMGPPPPGMRVSPSPIGDGMVPRPLTPTGRERSASVGRVSPTPMGISRSRSQSVSGAERPVSPVAMPARKPVPGQAI